VIDEDPAEPDLTPFDRVQIAWDALAAANEALTAVNMTGSKEWSRTGMRVVRIRTQAFLTALEAVMEATAE